MIVQVFRCSGGEAVAARGAGCMYWALFGEESRGLSQFLKDGLKVSYTSGVDTPLI